MTTYVFASTKEWNLKPFYKKRAELPGRWIVISDAADIEILREVSPRYAFFLHWSKIIPSAIVSSVECVCFHMTDLPFGRGGSPLQNLIALGKTQTMLSALRMTEELDAGPIYTKHPLDLSGSAEEIFARCANLAMDMVAEIVKTKATPTPQSGTPTVFKRRTPQQSAMPADASLKEVHDHIRMLDADTYPRAYLDSGGMRYTFSKASFDEGKLRATVEITKI